MYAVAGSLVELRRRHWTLATGAASSQMILVPAPVRHSTPTLPLAIGVVHENGRGCLTLPELQNDQNAMPKGSPPRVCRGMLEMLPDQQVDHGRLAQSDPPI